MRISDWSSDVAFRSVEDGVAQLQRRRLAAMLRADHRDRAEDAVLDAQRGTRAIKGDAGLARPLRVTVALQRPARHQGARSEKRRVGKESASTCRSRWSQRH